MTDTTLQPGFWKRNRDELILESIGGLFLALLVSVIISWLDQSREETRAARDEALSNSIFVRQAVMNESAVLPFSGLYLEAAQLSGLALMSADFSDADLTGAEIKDADLTGANLSETDLSGADLSDSILAGADLSEAALGGTIISGVDFTGATITAGALQGALYAEDEPPTGVDASEATSLTPTEADIDDDDD